MNGLLAPAAPWSPVVATEHPARVLAIGAHPDDIDFCAGGTLARWVGSGSTVSYCVVTDGDAGGHDRSVARAAMPSIRRDEQRAAATTIGASEVVFLGYRDGSLAVTCELRRDLARVIRRFRPDAIVCQSPQRNWLARVQANHPDHLAVGEATLCAVYPDARNPFAYPELLEEGLEPYHVPAVWIANPMYPNRVVDVTDTLGAKVAALAQHESQLPAGAEQMERHVRGDAERVADTTALGAGRMGEAFQLVVTEELH